jgi:NADPH:quinone reductase-like Zn-dependent oxidoreductase
MKAARIHRFGGLEVIEIEGFPVPQPGRREIRIRVHVASVNPVDYKIRQGAASCPRTSCRCRCDVAGIVDQVGPDAAAFAAGDAVFATLPPDRGGNAELVAATAEICARKPDRLDHVQTGALGLASLTAWQGLFDFGGLHQGQRVLVHAAAGGVGHLAVQFARARRRGVEVLDTCAAEDLEFVRGFGATEMTDYKAERFEERARDIDMVFDLVGEETQDRSWSVLRPGCIIVSTLTEPDKEKAQAHRARRSLHGAAKRDAVGRNRRADRRTARSCRPSTACFPSSPWQRRTGSSSMGIFAARSS